MRGRRSTTWIAAASGAVIASLLVACGGAAATDGAEGSAALGASDLAVVTLAIAPTGGPVGLCAGALVAPNVVLTARHCVSEALGDRVACDELGRSLTGDQMGDDVAAQNIAVYTEFPVAGRPPLARGRRVFRPEGAVLCNADVAVVVTDGPVADVRPLAVRLGGGASRGEALRTVLPAADPGATDAGSQRSLSIHVVATGSTFDAVHGAALGPREFEGSATSCGGGTAAVALSEATGAVVGILSRGGGSGAPGAPIFTTAAGFPNLLHQALAFAGQSVAPEPFGGALDGSALDGGALDGALDGGTFDGAARAPFDGAAAELDASPATDGGQAADDGGGAPGREDGGRAGDDGGGAVPGHGSQRPSPSTVPVPGDETPPTNALPVDRPSLPAPGPTPTGTAPASPWMAPAAGGCAFAPPRAATERGALASAVALVVAAGAVRRRRQLPKRNPRVGPR